MPACQPTPPSCPFHWGLSYTLRHLRRHPSTGFAFGSNSGSFAARRRFSGPSPAADRSSSVPVDAEGVFSFLGLLPITPSSRTSCQCMTQADAFRELEPLKRRCPHLGNLSVSARFASSKMHIGKLPFILHAIIETIAAASFIFRPQSQLPGPLSVEARLVLQSFGGLLLATSLVCLAVVAQSEPNEWMTRLVAAAMAFWHVWPCYRAGVRISRGLGEGAGTLGGPPVHLAVHVVLLLMFVVYATR